MIKSEKIWFGKFPSCHVMSFGDDSGVSWKIFLMNVNSEYLQTAEDTTGRSPDGSWRASGPRCRSCLLGVVHSIHVATSSCPWWKLLGQWQLQGGRYFTAQLDDLCHCYLYFLWWSSACPFITYKRKLSSAEQSNGRPAVPTQTRLRNMTCCAANCSAINSTKHLIISSKSNP